MYIGADFKKFDFKTALINFFQIFLIGWFVISLLLFLWSATSEYGLEKTVNDMSFDLFLSPVFWLFPLMVAVVISVARGVKRDSFDITSQEQLDAYMESQKFSNQPLWFKVFLGFFVLLFIFVILKPDAEISEKQYSIIENELEHVQSPELSTFHRQISEDGVIMGKEFKEFINLSMKLQISKATE